MDRLNELLDSMQNPWMRAGVVVLLSLAVAQLLRPRRLAATGR